jgi:hypothetical protein
MQDMCNSVRGIKYEADRAVTHSETKMKDDSAAASNKTVEGKTG